MVQRPASLVLEDGTSFQGRLFGAAAPRAGEVVFTTGMVGYTETLTDPSYSGQIIVFTYPLIGNYGVPESVATDGVQDLFEGTRIRAHGVVVAEYSDNFSHWDAELSLSEWLASEGVPGLTGIDTRALTKHLRERGTMVGRIDVDEMPSAAFENFDLRNLVEDASPAAPEEIGSGAARIALLDCGCKHNIVRSLLTHDARVTRLPWNADLAAGGYDAIVVSNGPGDPKKCDVAARNIRAAIDAGIPTFGICLGHQLIARAIGAETYKMKYGHRSQNQPVREVGTDHCFVTSQNHGYAVDPATLPAGWEPWFVNVSDGTNEGLRRSDGRVRSIQFHPEAAPGPVDTRFLLDDFLKEHLLTARR